MSAKAVRDSYRGLSVPGGTTGVEEPLFFVHMLRGLRPLVRNSMFFRVPARTWFAVLLIAGGMPVDFCRYQRNGECTFLLF